MIPDAAHLTTLFEGAPRFLGRLLAAAPFADHAAMFAAARSIAHAMPEAEQVELIDAHPRLGAPSGTVSRLSYAEQGYDRDAGTADPATDDPATATNHPDALVDVSAELARLNDDYEARFGFRYCVFVAGRSREELLPGIGEALGADRDAEIHRALDAVVDIAIDRHAKLSAST